MNTRGGKSNENITVSNIGTRQAAFHARPHQRQIPQGHSRLRIHSGHFGGFAANQGATGLSAALGNPLNHCRRSFDIQLAGGEIIEEEQRLSTLHDQVIDTHGNEINADRIVLSSINGDLQFRPDTVIGSNQNRIPEPGRFKIEQTAKTADLAVSARSPGGFDCRLDAFNQRIARINIDTGIGIGY